MKTFKDLYEDVRKMPDGGYGVYADKFKTVKTKDGKTKRQRIMTPGGQHAKELKKVYKYKIDSISIPLFDSQKVILRFNNVRKFVVRYLTDVLQSSDKRKVSSSMIRYFRVARL